MTGCGPPKSVAPVIDSVAHAQRLSDGTYQVELRYSVTSSGGPCFNANWFRSTTSYDTNWVYVKSLDGLQSASQIVVTSEAGKKRWPFATTNLQGTVSFSDGMLTVELQHPDYPDGVHMQGYAPYYLNGTYQVLTDSPPGTTLEPMPSKP